MDVKERFARREKPTKECVAHMLPFLPSEGPQAKFREAVLAIDPYYMNLTMRELRECIEVKNVDYIIRRAFHKEYLKAVDTNSVMNLNLVKGNKADYAFYFEYIFQDQAKLAWIIKEPMDYHHELMDLADMGVRRLREIMNIPIHKTVRKKQPDGSWKEFVELDPQAAKVVLQASKDIEQRLNGAPVQRIIQQQIKVEPTQMIDIGKVDTEIKQLEGELYGRDQGSSSDKHIQNPEDTVGSKEEDEAVQSEVLEGESADPS